MKSRIFSTASFLAVAIAIILTLNFSAAAQGTITGTITGSVKDASGASVPGATVTISDAQKDNIVVRTVTTNEEGLYSAPNLVSGVYTITIEAPNFKKSVNTDVKLDVGGRYNLDTTLEAGNVSEIVTVEADPVSVDLNTPTSSTLINGDQVRELSINNRNFVQLVALAPGVSSDLADQVYVGTTNPDGQANTVNLSVNGSRSSSNTFTVDGADITDRGSNLTIQGYPSVDSIGEFRVLRSLYPAESGTSGGGQVNVITRSGTSEFHGSLFEFVRNEKFNAGKFFDNQRFPLGIDENGKAIRAPFRYNNYGWTVGGPVYFFNFGEGGSNQGMFRRWDKTFFFFSQEFRKDRRSTSFTPTVPSQALRNGIFPIDVCINRNNVATENCTPGNPGRLTMGSPIPANMLSPAAVAYLNQIYNQFPLPNAVTATNPFGLVSSIPGIADFEQEIFKIDHSFTKNWSAFYRYQRDLIPTLDGNGLFASGSGLPGLSTQETDSPGRAQTIQSTYVVSPKFILEGRYSYSYGAILSDTTGTIARANSTIPITLPFPVVRDKNPTISANGFSALQAFGNYDNFSDKNNYSFSATWLEGNHTMKFGTSLSLFRKNENAIAGSNEGLFSAFPATLASGVVSTGTQGTINANIQRFANFLVGNVTTFTQARYDLTADLRQKNIEWYAQDEWKVRRNLTLYLGIRYSYFGAPSDANGRLTNFFPELWNPANAPFVTGAGNRVLPSAANPNANFCNGLVYNAQNPAFTAPTACALTPSPYGNKVVKTPTRDFAPRVGLAWDPFGTGKTSVRMGYGIYHEQVLNGVYLTIIGTNPPYQETLSISNTRLDNPLGGGTIGAASLAAPAQIRAIQGDWQTPYMQHWSLDVQQQIWKNTILTAGYYGSKGTNLIGIVDINLLAPGTARNSLCAQNTNFIGQAAAQTLVQCQPNGYAFRNAANVALNPQGNNSTTDTLILDQIRPYKGYRAINMIQPRFNSIYQSLQISAQHRFSGASQINLAYTWSKNFTDNQTDRSTAPQNPYNIAGEYGRSQLDRRHIFTFNYVYELPFFDKQEGFIGKILGGWQASGIVVYNTGLPFTATTSNFDPAGIGFLGSSVSGGRPNILCNPNEGAPNTQLQFFNTSCFQLNPASQAFGTANPALISNIEGTAGRGVIEGPRTFRIDFSMMKNIQFSERFRLQLRAEAFNVTNMTNFRTLDLNVINATFGNVTAPTRDPRVLQFAAKFYF
ncbi:MAG: TonB-dependent receptor [Pyrinomonadaceae bacterium]